MHQKGICSLGSSIDHLGVYQARACSWEKKSRKGGRVNRVFGRRGPATAHALRGWLAPPASVAACLRSIDRCDDRPCPAGPPACMHICSNYACGATPTRITIYMDHRSSGGVRPCRGPTPDQKSTPQRLTCNLRSRSMDHVAHVDHGLIFGAHADDTSLYVCTIPCDHRHV
jgi:hypothetical protein